MYFSGIVFLKKIENHFPIDNYDIAQKNHITLDPVIHLGNKTTNEYLKFTNT